MTARLPETYQWLLVPEQATPQAADRVAGDPALGAATRSPCGRARSSGTTSCCSPASPARACGWSSIDVPLWRGDHVAVKQLVEDFARYLYLPRLKDPEVLVGAIRDGVGLLTWQAETLRLRRQLRRGHGPLPRPARRAARRPDRRRLARPAREARRRPAQLDAERAKVQPVDGPGGTADADGDGPATVGRTAAATDPPKPRRLRQAVPRHGDARRRRASAATPAASPTRSSPTSPASSARR